MTETARVDFSIRLPSDVNEELERMAKAEGLSKNLMIANLIARASDGAVQPVGQSTRADISRAIALDACSFDSGAIGALIGIGRWLYGRGQALTAAVVWTAAARAVEADDDPDSGGRENASKQLALSARQLAKAKEFDVAIHLARESMTLNPRNRRAANLLGQWLVGRGQRENSRGKRDEARRDFEEAGRLLEGLRDFDNHARLFYGLAAIELAIVSADPTAQVQATDEIVAALRAWSFGATNPSDRSSWLRQVRRLVRYGDRESAVKLVDFANANSDWKKFDYIELDTDGEVSSESEDLYL